MPRFNQPQQGGGQGTRFTEGPEEKAAWQKLRQYISREKIMPGETFTLPGTITKIRFNGSDDNPSYFTEMVKDRNTGEMKERHYVYVICAITDPRFGTPGTAGLPPKKVTPNWFDGRNRDGTRGNARGGFYHIHVAALHEEPPQELVNGGADWETEWYENRPLLLRLVYLGDEDPGGRYADQRAGMRIFVESFERLREAAQTTDDGQPTPQAQALQAQANVAENAGISERQVKFIDALIAQAGMDEMEGFQFVLNLMGKDIDSLTRGEASTIIDALRRRVLEVNPPAGGPSAASAAPTAAVRSTASTATEAPAQPTSDSTPTRSGTVTRTSDDDVDF